MNQESKVINVALLAVWCFSLLTGVSRAISPEELQKIEGAMPTKATVTPKQPRKLLVFNLCKGYKHSAVPYGAEALEIMGRKTGAFEVVQSEDMSIFKPQNLKRFDAVCFNNTTKLDFSDPKLRRSLMDFVKGGKGIVGIHSATDNFYDWPEAAETMGGLFDGHPWGSKGTWAIKIDDPKHPLTAAFKGEDFKISDEIYRIKGFSREKLRVLISLDMADETNLKAGGVKLTDKDVPISWVHGYGKGRVFYCSLGHNHDIFWNPAVLQHYLDGVQFALGDLTADTTNSVEKVITEIAAYEYGQSRKPLTELNDFLRSAYDSPEVLKRIEKRLLKLLRLDATPAAKQFICRKLSIIGTEESVPTLTAMLTEPATSDIAPSDIARYALERIPGPAVDKALRSTLGKTSGKAKVGIINSLGQRGDRKSVPALRRLISSSDPTVAGAAVAALGKIADAKAVKVLASAKDKTTGKLRLLVLDAYLNCADQLVAQGKKAQALPIYKQLYSPDEPAPIRSAALRGMVMAMGDTGRKKK